MTSSSTTIGSNGTNVSTLPTDTMNTNNVSSTNGTSASDLQATFLKLLVTQLQNQDPTSPVDSSQMTSQLAQINTVSGIAQLNTSLTSLSSQLTAGQQTQAALLIGTNVLAPGNAVAVKGGAMDCPYTFMQDMVAGTYRLPWEDQVKITDGTSCGFPAPTRVFGKMAKAAE